LSEELPLNRTDDEISSADLTKRAVKASGWLLAARVVRKLLDMVKLIVLARLLTKGDFGLFGVVGMALTALHTFSQTGFDQALVQRKDDIESYLDTAWTVQLIRALALGAILFFAAEPIAAFFNDMRAASLLKVMAFSVVIAGTANIGIVYFKKELQFKKIFILTITGAVVSVVVGVILAYKLRSAWALVWAVIASTSVNCALSYFLHPYRPKLKFDREKAYTLMRYGGWVLAGTITIYFGSQLDYIFIGRVLGVSALGIYLMAYKISLLPITEFTYTVARIAMPSYAKLQGNPNRIRRAYDRLFQLTTALSIPACVGTIMIAPQIIDILLGSKWQEAVLPLQILMGAQLLKSIASTGSPLFMGAGKPRYEFTMQVFRAAALGLALYPMLKWMKLPGGSGAVVISAVAMFIPFFFVIGKVSGMKIRTLASRLILPLAGSVIMAAFLWGALVFFNSYLFLDIPSYPLVMKIEPGSLYALKAMKFVNVFLLGVVITLAAGIYLALIVAVSRRFKELTISDDVGTVIKTVKQKFARFI